MNTESSPENTPKTHGTDPAPPPLPPSPDVGTGGLEESTTNWPKISQVLRVLGAVSLALAAFTFLLGEAAKMEELDRYYLFLGFTGLLTGGGLFCAMRWSDSKGARTFLGLALAFVPVHFAYLGHLLFAPDYAESVRVTLGAISLPLLAGTTFVAYSAFARRAAMPFAGVFMLANFAFLLPTREGPAIAAIATVLLLVQAVAARFTEGKDPVLRTLEGELVSVLPYLPILILLGRNIVHFDPEAYLMVASFVIAGALCFYRLPRMISAPWLVVLLQLAGIGMVTLGGWILVGEYFDEAFHGSGVWGVYLLILVTGLITVGMSFFMRWGGNVVRALSAVLCVTVAVFVMLGSDTALATLCSIGIGAAYLVAGLHQREQGVFTMGVLGLVAGVIVQIVRVILLTEAQPWVFLAIGGFLVVLIASALEKFGGRLKYLRKDVDRYFKGER